MKFGKDSSFCFWVLQWWIWLSGPLKSMVIFILHKIWMVKLLKNLHIGLIAKKVKKLNQSNFFLIIIYILIQFKMFIYSPWKFIWSTDIQNTLLLVYWPPHGIAIDHSSIGLKRLTMQLVFIEAWLCCNETFTSQHVTSVYCNLTLACVAPEHTTIRARVLDKGIELSNIHGSYIIDISLSNTNYGVLWWIIQLVSRSTLY